MAETILDMILSDKKREVEETKTITPLYALKERISRRNTPLDFTSALRREGLNLIAEVKKASPSKGVLCPDLDPVTLAKTYEENGAAAISVLTESKYFQGNIEYLAAIREQVHIPLLRKDFIYDEYQVYESAAYGADALLLIVAVLEPEQLSNLLGLSRDLGLGCLVEVHNEEELMIAMLADAEIIGINNRNLDTFATDTNTTRRLRMLVPQGTVVVSESGIHERGDIRKMKECKVNAVLIGEALVTTRDIRAKIRELFL